MGRAKHQVDIPSDAMFWELVGLATREWDAFAARLAELSPATLAGFAAMYWGLASVFWQWAQDHGDCSEDAAEDVGGSLVARGREFFVAAIQEPEKIVTAELIDSLDGPGLRIMYAAERQYLARTGKQFVAASEGPYFKIGNTVYGSLVDRALRS